jgi:hypothetical protein
LWFASGLLPLADLFERIRDVATLACPSERAAVHIIRAVARVAIRRERNLRDIFSDVAGVAIEAAMRPGQWVTCLFVMVKAPPRPAIWIVAKRAVGPETAFMTSIPVAGCAAQQCVLEAQRTMALFARHDGVAPDEWESRDVMIERGYASPIVLPVTLFATIAEPPAVPIILPVTGYARRCQLVAVEIAGMTSVAPDLRVCGSQRKVCRLVMIETNGAPLVLVMTAFALGTISAAVDVLNAVAIGA